MVEGCWEEGIIGIVPVTCEGMTGIALVVGGVILLKDEMGMGLLMDPNPIEAGLLVAAAVVTWTGGEADTLGVAVPWRASSSLKNL